MAIDAEPFDQRDDVVALTSQERSKEPPPGHKFSCSLKCISVRLRLRSLWPTSTPPPSFSPQSTSLFTPSIHPPTIPPTNHAPLPLVEPLIIRHDSPEPSPGASTPRLALVGLAVLVLALFAWNVHRWWFLDDDAFISFRYARHWVEGLGLVWNPGERVEGYTNFLWVAAMAAGMRAGLEPEVLAPVLGVACGVFLLWGSLRWTRASGSVWPLWFVAPATLALSRTFTGWCSGGLETQAYAALLFGGWSLVPRVGRGVGMAAGTALVFVAATLTRPDGGLAAACAGAALLVLALRGRVSARAVVAFAAVFVVCLATHVAWRLHYYGEWLPNTFYAKVTGARWKSGAFYLHTFLQDYRAHWFLPLTLVGWWARRSWSEACLGLWVLAYLTYIVSVGGDFHEFRFLVPVLPFLAVWNACGIAGLARVLAGPSGVAWRRAVAGGVAVLLTASLLGVTHHGSVREEAQVGRAHGRVGSLPGLAKYTRRRTMEGKLLRGWIDDGRLPADLILATGGAGALPYYARVETIDVLGLNDHTVARLPVDKKRAVIGHERRAPMEYLAERNVDLIDAVNGLVWRGAQKAPKNTRVIPTPVTYKPCPLRHVRIDGKLLVFGTTLDEEAFRQRFRAVDIVR